MRIAARARDATATPSTDPWLRATANVAVTALSASSNHSAAISASRIGTWICPAATGPSTVGQARQGQSSQLGPARGIAAHHGVLGGEGRGGEQLQRRRRRPFRLPQRLDQRVQAPPRRDPHVCRRRSARRAAVRPAPAGRPAAAIALSSACAASVGASHHVQQLREPERRLRARLGVHGCGHGLLEPRDRRRDARSAPPRGPARAGAPVERPARGGSSSGPAKISDGRLRVAERERARVRPSRSVSHDPGLAGGLGEQQVHGDGVGLGSAPGQHAGRRGVSGRPLHGRDRRP